MNNFFLQGIRNRLRIIIATLISINLFTFSQTQIPAFPGAEGWGKYTSGGRGGSVYIVTNLNNSGPGSLREAVSQPNRIVVFRVSGTINLKSELVIKGNITIAGQTAPGDGICVKGYPTKIDGNNVIIRYMRFRLGDENNLTSSDALDINNDTNIIIDHCSMSWGVDEVFSTYWNKNVTVQYCIVGEGLNYNNHSMGGLWGAYSTYHHNLIHSNRTRHPKYAYIASNELADSRNNVIYNWGIQSAYTGEQGNLNLINNYYKPGPATSPDVKKRILQADPDVNLYAEGNYMAGSPEVTADNWDGGIDPLGGMPTRLTLPHPVPYDFPTQSAIEAYYDVLAHAGASYPLRDSVDLRMIKNVIDSTGYIINRQNEVGGYPLLFSAPAPKDSDNDGMPDTWEISNGLDPYNPTDANGDFNNDGYTNIEKYINSLINYPFATTFYIKTYGTNSVIFPFNTDTISTKNYTKKDSISIWLLTPASNGFYSITNLKTGLALEVKNGSIEENELITQGVYTGGDHQQWEIIKIDSFVVIKNKKSQLVLDLKILENKDTILIQNSFNNKNTQKFLLSRYTNDNIAPKVTLLSPKTGNLFNVGENILLEATASDDQYVAKLDFYVNGKKLVTLTEEPYSYTWTNVPEGIYTISALAYDQEGLTGTSTEVTVVVLQSLTPEGKMSYVIQENETGFCGVEGKIESEHLGFTGTGYSNTDNATGKGINWKIFTSKRDTLSIEWRHANGSSARPAKLIINGNTIVSSINFPATGAWTNYQIVSTNVPVDSGLLSIRLEATTSGGLSNIDFVKFTGRYLKMSTCNGQIIDKIYEYKNFDNVSIYPNPVKNVLNISIKENISSPLLIKIIDISGKTIFENKYYAEGDYSINTEIFPRGLNFVLIKYGSTIDVKKIILH